MLLYTIPSVSFHGTNVPYFAFIIMIISLQLVKELQRLRPKTDTSDPRISLCQGIARYKKSIIELLQSRKNLPVEVKNILNIPPDTDVYACKL